MFGSCGSTTENGSFFCRKLPTVSVGTRLLQPSIAASVPPSWRTYVCCVTRASEPTVAADAGPAGTTTRAAIAIPHRPMVSLRIRSPFLEMLRGDSPVHPDGYSTEDREGQLPWK